MGISVQMLLTVCGGASAIATGIFWGAYYMGKYISRLESVEQKVEVLDRRVSVFENAGV